jgi:hypothetical protein
MKTQNKDKILKEKIKYYSPIWGTSSYKVGHELHFDKNVYLIIKKTNKSLKLKFLRFRQVGRD